MRVKHLNSCNYWVYSSIHSWYVYLSTVYEPKWPYWIYILHILDCWGQVNAGFIQVLYLGRAPRTKETLPDFLKRRRVTRHPLVFRGLTGSQRTPGFGASQTDCSENLNVVQFLFACVFKISQVRKFSHHCSWE